MLYLLVTLLLANSFLSTDAQFVPSAWGMRSFSFFKQPNLWTFSGKRHISDAQLQHIESMLRDKNSRLLFSCFTALQKDLFASIVRNEDFYPIEYYLLSAQCLIQTYGQKFLALKLLGHAQSTSPILHASDMKPLEQEPLVQAMRTVNRIVMDQYNERLVKEVEKNDSEFDVAQGTFSDLYDRRVDFHCHDGRMEKLYTGLYEAEALNVYHRLSQQFPVKDITRDDLPD